MLFVLLRFGYYLAGVRFDARPILHYFQFVDPELLKHRLIESMYYLHAQPPGWNIYIGIALKLFPRSYPIALHIAHLVMGLAICWLIYYLMRRLGVNRRMAFVLTAWFTVSPGVVLFENYLLYEYVVGFLLVAALFASAIAGAPSSTLHRLSLVLNNPASPRSETNADRASVASQQQRQELSIPACGTP